MLSTTLRNTLLSALICAAMHPAWAANGHHPSNHQYVYTISNADTGNAIVGYKVMPDGTLQPLPGSPYGTGGLGQGHTLLVSSDNGLVVSQDKRFLFAPNRGTNEIAVFRIRADGSLTPVPGSPFPSGGITPTSLAVSGNLLFVAHSGLGLLARCPDCDYRGFSIGEEGRLTPIDGATVNLSADPASGPLAIRFTPDGKFLIGTEIVSSRINVYAVRRDAVPGQPVLVPAPGSPFANNEHLPLGFNFNPVNPTQLFVSNVGNPPTGNAGSVSAYLLAKTGQIAAIDQPAANGQSATCWINLTHDGKWLFATNTDSDTITTYAVAADGRLTLKTNLPVPHDSSRPADQLVSPVDMAMTAGDEYLYVLLRDVAAVVGYKIGSGGELTLTSNSPLNVPNAFPFGLTSVDLDQGNSDD